MKNIQKTFFAILIIAALITVFCSCDIKNDDLEGNQNEVLVENPESKNPENENPENEAPDEIISEIETAEFFAEIKEIGENHVLVSPNADTIEAMSSDIISISTPDLKFYDTNGIEIEKNQLEVGMTVKVIYDQSRGIAESYPAQIWGIAIYLCGIEDCFPSNLNESVKSELTVNDLDNAAMNVIEGTASKTGITVEVVGTNEYELICGSYYRVEKYIDGEWFTVPYIIDGETVGWTSEAYMISETPHEFIIDWAWLYGELESGAYRIIKDIMVFRQAGDYDSYYLSAEFEL